MGKNSVPDRWENYSNMGRPIAGTRFIAFKVPLAEKFNHRGGNFSIRDLTDHCTQLGLVVDLTNTDRYYSPQSLTELNIEYKKIYTEGQVVPSTSVVKQFIDAVNAFFEKNEHNNKIVGVHCTHGVNRTGYLICRYMIQVMDIAPDQAIADFNSARGHNQERTHYTEDLCQALWMDEDPATYKVNTTKGKRGGYNNNNDNHYNQRKKFRGNSYGQDNYSHPPQDYYNSNEYDIQYQDDNSTTNNADGRESYSTGGYGANEDATNNADDSYNASGSGGKNDESKVSEPQTPEAASDGGSLFNTSSGSRRRSSGKKYARRSSGYSKGMSIFSPDAGSSWAVDPSEEESTSRGVKRPHHSSERSSSGPYVPPNEPQTGSPLAARRPLHVTDSRSQSSAHGPWLEDGQEERPRLKFKRGLADNRYSKNPCYDPYFYQQRQGKGPARGPSVIEPSVPIGPIRGARASKEDNTTRKYKGPKRHVSPQRLEEEVASPDPDLLALENNEPLTIPSDVSLQKDFLDSPAVAGPTRNPKSPCTQPDVFSPEAATAGTSSKRRKSKRFEPY